MAAVAIDSGKGGNGDVWMRLVSLYAVAAIYPSVQISVFVPPFMQRLATHIFSDRLFISCGRPSGRSLIYTSLGIKNLVIPIIKGCRFISPYGRQVLRKKGNFCRQVAGNMLYAIFDRLGVIQSPPAAGKTVYQGYEEITAVKAFRKTSYNAFCRQLKKDMASLQYKSVNGAPVSRALHIPGDLHQYILVFPAGTARQFIPVWWAKKFLPHACYAFFYKDKMANAFLRQGLKVVYFYEEPGDIIELAKYARHTLSTDSFPSHLLQYATGNCSITITEAPANAVTSPAFTGRVIDAVAPCHPCLHMDRGNHPLCQAGYEECINWKSEVYTKNILSAVCPVKNII
ncbi:hypothetical protein [Parafilimonas sp.]|uniref:hypothetical protein n=1 Tax=Parafilimonas sp. TaxID=1969739 RepID=UPI0039E6771F